MKLTFEADLPFQQVVIKSITDLVKSNFWKTSIPSKLTTK